MSTAPVWPEADPAVIAPVEEHEQLRAVVRQLLERSAPPDRLAATLDSPSGSSPELWRLLNDELEISALAVPEELGGQGYGLRELVVVLEETGAALLPEPVLASAVLGCQALALADDADAVADVRTEALRGAAVVTLATSRGATPVAAEQSGGDGSWTVSGSVPRVLQAAGSDLLVLPADGPAGPVLLLVRTADAVVAPRPVLDLTRRQAEVVLDRTPARLLVGSARSSAVVARLGLLADVAVAAEHAGIVDRLLSMTCTYAGQREQFGRPVASFQAVKHRLADVLVDRERARGAARYAAAVLDEDPDAAALPVAVAATVCTDAVLRAAHEAVQLHGGIGFTWEHPCHLYLRRALGDEGLWGDSRAHRARVASLIGV